MAKMMTRVKRIKTALWVLLGTAALPLISAQAQMLGGPGANVKAPEMYVVMFRADWCPPCKIVEPNLAIARDQMRDGQIEFLTFDVTTEERQWASANIAFDRQIVPYYNQWFMTTGFAAIIDADTKRVLGCVDQRYGPEDMKTHIQGLKQVALSNAPHVDFTCPAVR